MDEKIKADWEQDKTDRCPYCGSYDFEWVESDDATGHAEWDEKNHTDYWVDDGFHWYVWYCHCYDCDKSWYIKYEMVNPRVYVEEE